MIKIIYPDGKVEYQDVRRLTVHDLFLVFGSWATMKYLYTTHDTAGRPVDFYIVYQQFEYEDGSMSIRTQPFNQKVFEDYGMEVFGTAIVCKADILDTEE